LALTFKKSPNPTPSQALAIATGASQLFPMRPQSSSSTPESVESAFRQMQTSIASAKRILVIGGGPTGIEFTGEVLAQHPDKSITLVHRNTTLLDDRFPAKLAAGLETQLRNKGVELLLGQHLDVGDGFNVGAQEGEKEFVTREGKVIKGELEGGGFRSFRYTRELIGGCGETVSGFRLHQPTLCS
jgi:NADH dehydrogenase FAD-containing subunit